MGQCCWRRQKRFWLRISSLSPTSLGLTSKSLAPSQWWELTGLLDIHTTWASLSAPIGPFYSQPPLSSGQLPPWSQVDNSVELLSRAAQVFSENHRPGSPLPKPRLSLKNPDLPGLRELETVNIGWSNQRHRERRRKHSVGESGWSKAASTLISGVPETPMGVLGSLTEKRKIILVELALGSER